jgi:hypothetical protein
LGDPALTTSAEVGGRVARASGLWCGAGAPSTTAATAEISRSAEVTTAARAARLLVIGTAYDRWGDRSTAR